VVRGFVIQGGGYGKDLGKKPVRDPVANEADNGFSNKAGTVAMARSGEKDSAADEFFINVADNPELDHGDETDEGFGYCVFGRVVDGMDVVRKINWKVVRPKDGFEDLPVEPVVIISAQRFD
jgi:cyclophilin family peptidyl-prolyl cis-trans isomerase